MSTETGCFSTRRTNYAQLATRASVNLDFISKTNPVVFAVARAIVEGSGGNPDATVPYEGPAPVWTDHRDQAKEVLLRTAIMLRANGFQEAATYLDRQADA